MKKLMSLILCVALAVSLIATLSVFAEETWTAPDGYTQIGTSTTAWKFDSSTNTLTITGTGQVESFASADAQPWKDNRSSIKNLVVESGITGLTNFNLSKCDLSGTISLPDTLTYIGYNTFSDTKITNLDFVPDSVWNNMVTYNAFTMNCSSLKGTLTLPANVKTISAQSFQNTQLTSITIEGGADAPALTINAKAFVYMPKLTKLTIKRANVTFGNVKNNATTPVTNLDAASGNTGLFTLSGNWNLTPISSLNIMCPQSVKNSLEALNDYETYKPQNIYVIPDVTEKCDIGLTGLTNGYWAYNDGTLNLYGTGEYTAAHYQCGYAWKDAVVGTDITKVVFNEGITAIPAYFCGNADYATYKKMVNIAEIKLPSTLKTINAYAFMDCKKLKTVSGGFPEGLETIGKQAFQACPLNATKNGAFILPASLKTIGIGAFQTGGGGSSNYNSIIFAKGSQLTTIGKQAFDYRYNVKTVEIPSNVTEIGDNAFRSTSTDTLTVYFEGTKPATIGTNAFARTGTGASVKVYCYQDGFAASDFGNLEYLTVQKLSPVLASGLTLTVGDTDVTASATFRAPAAMAANQDYILIIAAYDEDTLVDVNIDTTGVIEPDTTNLEKGNITKTIDKVAGATKYKVFLWDSLAGCTPITEAK